MSTDDQPAGYQAHFAALAKEHLRDQQRIADALEFGQTIVQSSPIGINTYTAEGVCVSANAAAGRILDIDPARLVGQNLHDIPFWRSSGLEEAARLALDSGQPVSRQVHGTDLLNRELWWNVTLAPFTAGGEPHLLFMFADDTERQRGEEWLRLANERFEQLASHISEIFWVVDHTHRRIEYLSPAFDRIFGLDRAELDKNHRLFNQRIHPEDAALMRQAQIDENAGRPTDLEYRYLHPDGSTRWIWERSSPVLDAQGGLLRTVGMSSDITANKLIQLQIKERESFLRSIVGSSPGDIMVVDLDGVFTYSSQDEEDAGAPAQRGRLADQVHPEQAAQAAALLAESIRTQRVRQMELRKLASDGLYHWFEVVFSPVIVDGEVRQVTLHTHDINDRKLAEEQLALINQQLSEQLEMVSRLKDQLQEQAVRDPLTNLYNRRYLGEVLPRLLLNARRKRTSISVLIVDIDHFKSVNDTYGHQVGDEVLKTIAALLLEAVRGSDVVFRYGGEEFLLLLPGLDEATAVARAEGLRQRVAEMVFPTAGDGLRLTISLGLAVYPQHAGDMDELLNQADAALYHSKRSGRNRLTAWSAAING